MFDKMKDQFKQLQMLQRLMKDENFRKLMSHPKVQATLQDPDVQQLAKSQDLAKLLAHPKMATLMRDPEVSTLFTKLDPQKFLNQA